MARISRNVVLKVVRVGNSRGVRLPKALIEKFAIKDELVLEERVDGLLLRADKDRRLGWAETFKATAREHEDWSDFDAAVGDGIDPREKW
jgi:antitoxin MazE